MFQYETTEGRKGVASLSELQTMLQSLKPDEAVLLGQASQEDLLDRQKLSKRQHPALHDFLRRQVKHA